MAKTHTPLPDWRVQDENKQIEQSLEAAAVADTREDITVAVWFNGCHACQWQTPVNHADGVVAIR